MLQVNVTTHNSKRVYSQAYMQGWSDAASMKARNNPYEENSAEYHDYERGYTESLADDDHM